MGIDFRSSFAVAGFDGKLVGAVARLFVDAMLGAKGAIRPIFEDSGVRFFVSNRTRNR